MDVKNYKQWSGIVAVVCGLGMLVLQCTVDPVARPAPRIDLRIGGSEPSSDTIQYQYPTKVSLTVYSFAVAGLKKQSVRVNDSTVIDTTYSSSDLSDMQMSTCDTVECALNLSGDAAVNRIVTISVTDWQDKTTEKSFKIIYTAGEMIVVKPTFVSNTPQSTTPATTSGDNGAVFRCIATNSAGIGVRAGDPGL